MLRYASYRASRVVSSRQVSRTLNRSARRREGYSSLCQAHTSARWKLLAGNICPFELRTQRRRISADSGISRQDWERETRETLDAKAMPLGTMSQDQVDKALDTIQNWLAPKNDVMSAYDVKQADRLLQRLVAEHATKTMTIRRYTDTLAETQKQMLQAWLSFGSYLMALEHADGILFRLVDWYYLARVERIQAKDFVMLSELWLDANTMEAVLHVVDLLLWWTDDPEAEFASPIEISPLFHNVLERLHSKSHKEVTKSLIDRMEMLHSDWGWDTAVSNHMIDEPETQKEASGDIDRGLQSQSESAEPGDDGDEVLSSFELATMRQRFLDFLETASADDAPKVEEFTKRWSSLSGNHAERNDALDVYRGVYDYYLRVEDPRRATAYLQKIDQHSNWNTDVLPPEKWNRLLCVWSNTRDELAPWRAQELVQRMEELSTQGIMPINSTSYNLLAETWLNSSDTAAGDKILDITIRQAENNNEGQLDLASCRIVLRLMDKGMSVDISKLVNVVLSFLNQDWTGAPPNELQNLLEKTMDNLRKKWMSHQAQVLVPKAVSRGLVMTQSMCENALISHSSQATTAIKTLNFLEQVERNSANQASLSFACYEAAVVSLLNSGRRGTFEKEKELMSRLLDRLKSGEVAISPASDADRFLSWVLYKMRAQGRAYDSHAMLGVMEEKLLKDRLFSEVPLPVDCFNHVLQALSKAGERDKVEEVFSRLLAYYRSGHEHLMPTTTSFGIYLTCLTKDGQVETAETAERVLDEMIDLYEASGLESCKPDAGIFNAVLISWKKFPSTQTVDRACTVLERMLRLGVKPETFTFNVVMAMVTKVDDDSYQKVLKMMNRLVDLGLEPNSTTYNVLLNACASAKRADRQHALNKAVETMGHVRELGVDMATYSTFVKALRRLLPKGDSRRDRLVTSTFQLCCKDGYLSPDLEQQFRSLLSQEAWKKMYKGKLLQENMIPLEWTRNTNQERQKRASINI